MTFFLFLYKWISFTSPTHILEMYYYIPHAMEKHWFEQQMRWHNQETIKRKRNCFRIFLVSWKYILPCGTWATHSMDPKLQGRIMSKSVAMLNPHDFGVQKASGELFFMKLRDSHEGKTCEYSAGDKSFCSHSVISFDWWYTIQI